MIKPELYDVIEIVSLVENPNVPMGSQGTIVFEHPNDTYEVEFVNEQGETIALETFHHEQFIVVWQVASPQAVSIADQVAQLVARLPQQNGNEVLDFARFLSMRRAIQTSAVAA